MIALIIAEAISNALEHVFQSRGNGNVHIHVQRASERTLHIGGKNDGQGVAVDFAAAKTPSLCLRIATTLARQLNGAYSLRSVEDGIIARLEVETLVPIMDR